MSRATPNKSISHKKLYFRKPKQLNDPKKKKMKPTMDLEKRLRLQAAGVRVATMNWLKDHPDNPWPGLYEKLVQEALEKK